MTKREKRLEKGIISIDEQIKFHEEKKKKAKEVDMEELVRYYEKEIAALEKRKKNRQELLDKQ